MNKNLLLTLGALCASALPLSLLPAASGDIRFQRQNANGTWTEVTISIGENATLLAATSNGTVPGNYTFTGVLNLGNATVALPAAVSLLGQSIDLATEITGNLSSANVTGLGLLATRNTLDLGNVTLVTGNLSSGNIAWSAVTTPVEFRQLTLNGSFDVNSSSVIYGSPASFDDAGAWRADLELTSAATGNATGLSSGTVPDARLSGNVVIGTMSYGAGMLAQNGSVTAQRRPAGMSRHLSSAASFLGTNSNSPVDVLIVGDSTANPQIAGALQRRLGEWLGGSLGSTSGNATWTGPVAGATPTGWFYDLSANKTLTVGGYISSVLPVPATKVVAFYTSEPTSGNFALDVLDSAGNQTDTLNVTSSSGNASTLGGVANITLSAAAGNQYSPRSVRVRHLSGNAVKIAALGVFMNPTVAGTTRHGVRGWAFAQSGISNEDFENCPEAVVRPWLNEIGPEVIVFLGKNNDDWRTIHDQWKGWLPNTEFVFISASPWKEDVVSPTTETAENALDEVNGWHFERAGSLWVDSNPMWGTWTSCNATGLFSDDRHLSTAGQQVEAAFVANALCGPQIASDAGGSMTVQGIGSTHRLITTGNSILIEYHPRSEGGNIWGEVEIGRFSGSSNRQVGMKWLKNDHSLYPSGFIVTAGSSAAALFGDTYYGGSRIGNGGTPTVSRGNIGQLDVLHGGYPVKPILTLQYPTGLTGNRIQFHAGANATSAGTIQADRWAADGTLYVTSNTSVGAQVPRWRGSSASEPTNPAVGDLYINTGNSSLGIYNGSAYLYFAP